LIGYRISRAKLEKLIEQRVPGWLARAAERTARFRAMGKYRETAAIWSEIKDVFMELQGGSKCAFCERKLESITYGKGEQAIEHFRPKGNVKTWRPPAALTAGGLVAVEPPVKKGGYFLLPYDVFNYSVACNPCNSGLKRDYFPAAKKHQLTGASPEALLKERPLLIYPIGDFDELPEKLIGFHGVSPYPVAPSGHRRHRALATIEFFQLDDPSRQNLILERARILVALFPALRILHQPRSGERAMAQQIVDGFTSPSAPHTNCARSFVRLFRRRPRAARELFQRAAELIASKS
jgi:hypothetical protein